MRKFLISIIVLTICSIFLPININADGMIVTPERYIMQESGQKAVIFYEKGKETLILSMSFKGDAKDFGWVIPVPQKPEVNKGSDEIFTSIEIITNKYKRNYYNGLDLMAPLAMEAGRTSEPVTVIETKKIDYYDVAVLSAIDSQALAKWLSDNGYQYPEESAYILNDYIQNEWYFVAVKISPEAAGATEVIKGLEEGHVSPLKIEFDSDAIIYPLRISAIESGQGIIKLSDNLFLNQERAKHLKDIGYGDLADKENGPEIFNQIVQDLLTKKSYSESSAKSYPLIIQEWNFDNDSCFSFEGCRSTVESWFNNYFSRIGYYYYDSSNYVPIYLYVIAENKKEIPGFTTDYANWIKTSDIKKLAYDVNGKSLISPQGGKYYLTSLYRSISVKDMTSDLVIRDAENNKRVNAPNTSLNFLWGAIIALGCFFVWMLSPLGLIFIISTLVRALVKIDIVRIFGRVFQSLSFALTLGLFIFFLVMALKFSDIAVEYLWAIGLTCGLGLVLAGQIIIGKKF